jgi:hypothetical protein
VPKRKEYNKANKISISLGRKGAGKSINAIDNIRGINIQMLISDFI